MLATAIVAVHPTSSSHVLAHDWQVVECQSDDGVLFNVKYDKLAICTGSQVGVERGLEYNLV